MKLRTAVAALAALVASACAYLPAQAEQNALQASENSSAFVAAHPLAPQTWDNIAKFEINPALRALASNSYGSSCSAITSPYPYQWCVDATQRLVKLYTAPAGSSTFSWQTAFALNADGTLNQATIANGTVVGSMLAPGAAANNLGFTPPQSVAGRSGNVVLTSSDLTDGTAAGRTLFTAPTVIGQRTALYASQAGSANQFQTGFDTNGLPTFAQPGFGNLSGSLACSQRPALTGDVTASAGSCATAVPKLGSSLFATASGSSSSTDATTLQSSLTSAAAVGGAHVGTQYGKNYLLNSPLIMSRGTYFDGVCPTIDNDTFTPTLLCARLTASANMASILATPDTTAAINSTTAGNTSITIPTGTLASNLAAGMTLTLSGGAASELVTVASTWSYNSASPNLPVTLQSAVVNSGQTTVAWKNPTHSIGLKDQVVSGNKATNTVANLVDWSPINGKFADNQIVNGTGNCINHRSNASAAWVDWYTGNTVGGCAGIGLNTAGSDSWYLFNYFSGNGTNAQITSTGGGSFALNTVEVAAGDGLVIQNSAVAPFTAMSVLGTYFNQNATADVHAKVGSGTTTSLRSPMVGNVHHVSAGDKIDANVTDGLIVGDYFSQPTTAYDVSFSGSSNTGWQLIGTSHTLSPSARFVNLPPDAQVITGGPGGALNRLQSLSLASPTSGAGISQDTRLNVFGNDTVLSETNVSARFSMGRNLAGYDPALLFGSKNGNSPFMAVRNGDSGTAAGAFQAYFNGSSVYNWDASAFRLSVPLVTATATPATSSSACSTGQFAFDATYIYTCVATNTWHRASNGATW